MHEPQERLLSGVKRELTGFAGELRALAVARWDLAWLEVRGAGRSIRRLSVPLMLALTLLISALPVLVVWVCEVIANSFGIGRAWPLGLSVLLLITVAVALSLAAWRRFQREFVGLEETLDELREDIVWLKEWNEHKAGADASAEDSENVEMASPLSG